MPSFLRLALPLILAASLALVVAANLAAVEPVNTGWFNDLALDGYDPVAYFTDGTPVQGSKKHTTTYRGATWRFASAEHRELFEADPTRYAPQYGGYCAWAVAQGKTADADPEVWAIVDGKLYLNYNRKIGEDWEADRAGHIAAADVNWPELLDD
ncbi:MAG: YHS domain-containing (seleno)protein [Acidobacteriota bacterium]